MVDIERHRLGTGDPHAEEVGFERLHALEVLAKTIPPSTARKIIYLWLYGSVCCTDRSASCTQSCAIFRWKIIVRRIARQWGEAGLY
jgi:hypothetical protein